MAAIRLSRIFAGRTRCRVRRAFSTDILDRYTGSGNPRAEEELRWEYHNEVRRRSHLHLASPRSHAHTPFSLSLSLSLLLST